LPLLGELGLGDVFLNAAGPEVRRVGLFANETVLASAMPQASDTLGWGRALGREHLDLFLLEAAARAGVKVWQPWQAGSLRHCQQGHACTIAAKAARRELFARVIVAANGSWERGPIAGGAASAHKPSDLLAFKAHFKHCDLPADLMPLLIFPGGYGGMVHSDRGRVSLSCCIRRDQLMRSRERQRNHSAAEAVLQHIQTSCAGVRQALRNAKLDGEWLSAGPIRPGIRRRYADDVFRVGNIAGEAHPIIAEGISMAMQSAWLLGQRLIARKDRALSGIGSEYAAEWSRWFAPRIYAAAVFAKLAMNRNAATLGVPVLRQFPGVLTFGALLSGKAKQMIRAH
jgi:flavin-dependent dehydrogenase